MLKQQTIKCAFCQGTGKNPHFRGTCPVCKGRGKNQITGAYINCSDCRGSGRKLGTTLTCYSCGGLGVAPDRRAIIKRAKEEFKRGLAEMEEEREELKEKMSTRQPSEKRNQLADRRKVKEPIAEESGPTRYCQSCANEVTKDTLVKICLKCFKKLKKETL